MAMENARKFLAMVLEDESLQNRTAHLVEEEVLAVAKEMGLNFTAEEMKNAAAFHEMSPDEMSSAAGGGVTQAGLVRRRQAEHIRNPKDAESNQNADDEEGHIWVKTGHYEDEWFGWLKEGGLWSTGYDTYVCSHCGKTKEVKV